MLALVVADVGAWGMARKLPTGLPANEDQGYIIVSVQLRRCARWPAPARWWISQRDRQKANDSGVENWWRWAACRSWTATNALRMPPSLRRPQGLGRTVKGHQQTIGHRHRPHRPGVGRSPQAADIRHSSRRPFGVGQCRRLPDPGRRPAGMAATNSTASSSAGGGHGRAGRDAVRTHQPRHLVPRRRAAHPRRGRSRQGQVAQS